HTTEAGAIGQPSAPASKTGTNCGSSGTEQTRVGTPVGVGGVVAVGAGAVAVGLTGVAVLAAVDVAEVSGAGVAVTCDVAAATGTSVAEPGPSRFESVAQPMPTEKAKMPKSTMPAIQNHLRLPASCDERGSWSGMISKSSGFATVLYLPMD